MKNDQAMMDESMMGGESIVPEEDHGTSVTITFHPDGQIMVGSPYPAEPMDRQEEAAPAKPSMRDGGYMAQPDSEEAGEAGGGKMFDSMDKAIRYLLQVADSVSPAQDEEEGMSEGYGEEGAMSQKGLM